jgi:dipeptidyl aminopeptidase/acylaminoacyl peptidase
VPVMGGEQMYQALNTLGVPAQLIVYPGEHHIIDRPSFLIDMATRMSDWLERYVR